MSFISQYSNEGEITGWLDIKSELTREKGLLKKIKSPWKRRFCTAFRMVEVGHDGQRLTTIRLDTYPDKQSFSRSATCQSYGLIAGDVVRIVRCLSSTRRYAFSIYKKATRDECACPEVEAYIQLAGDSESDSQGWIRFFRECLFPAGKVPLDGTYDLTIIDNLSSRHSRLTGNVALDAQVDGMVLLRQEDAATIAIWPYGAVKAVQLVPTDVPQDLHKILRILIAGVGGDEQDFRFFSRKPLNELDRKLTALSFKNATGARSNNESDVHRHSKSHSTGGPSALPGRKGRLSTVSIQSDDGGMHFCREDVFDLSAEEEDKASAMTRASTSYMSSTTDKLMGKTRNNNLSCPNKDRKLPPIPIDGQGKRGSIDDTFYAYQLKKVQGMPVSPLWKQTSRDSGKGSTADEEVPSNSGPLSANLPSPTSPTSPSRKFVESCEDARTSRGDSGTSFGEELEAQEEALHQLPQRTTGSWRSQPGKISPPDTTADDNSPEKIAVVTHLTPLLYDKKDSEDTIVGSRESIDLTYEELNAGGRGRKNIATFLGMNDLRRPTVPPKQRAATMTTYENPPTTAASPPPALPPNHPPAIRAYYAKSRAHSVDQSSKQSPSGHEIKPDPQPTNDPSTHQSPIAAKSISPRPMVDLEGHQRVNDSEGMQTSVNLPQDENIPFYDVPNSCDQCKVNCKCRNGECSHARLKDSTAALPVGFLEGSITKDPSLVYDLPGAATMSDKLVITLKQQNFFINELQKQGTWSMNISSPSESDYDMPRGCHATGCPCSNVDKGPNASPKLPAKKRANAKSVGPKPLLPPKTRQILL